MKIKLFAIALFLPSVIMAGGYQINTQGVKAMGFGGFSTAMALDASTVYYNPGAMSWLKQNSVTAGFNVSLPFTSYLDPYDGNTDMNMSPQMPFNLYGVYQLKHKLTTGISVNTPFGIHTKWKDDWVGRYVSQEKRLQTLFIQPALSYEVNEHLSIGGGPVAAWLKSKQRKAVDVSSSSVAYGESEYESSGTGAGYNVGAYFKVKNLSIGVSYRSQIKIKLNNGKATFSDIPNGAVILEGIPASADFKADVKLPSDFDLGVAYNFTDKLWLTANFSLTGWKADDSIVYRFNDVASLNYSEPDKMVNSKSFSLGGQYHYNERMWFRAGLAFEETPVPDGYVCPSAPDANKLSYCGGITYIWKTGITIDASIKFQDDKLRIEKNNQRYIFNGEYKTTLYILGIGLNYAF